MHHGCKITGMVQPILLWWFVNSKQGAVIISYDAQMKQNLGDEREERKR